MEILSVETVSEIMCSVEASYTCLGTGKIVRLCLFDKVTNSKKMRELLFMGSLDCALIKPSFIADELQVVWAAEKALLREKNGTMKTRNVNTELLFCLHADNQVSEALKCFGITDTSKEVMAVTLDDQDGSKMKNFRQSVEGEIVATKNLSSFSDLKAISNLYKISDLERSVSDSVCFRIATSELVQRGS